MIFSKHESESPLVQKMKDFCDKRLESLRSKNDSPEKDAVETAFLRGQIAECKKLRSEMTHQAPLQAPPKVPDPYNV